MAVIRPLDVFLAKVVPWPTAAMPGFVNIHWLQPNLSGPAGRAFTDHRKACSFVFGMKRGVTRDASGNLQTVATPNERRDLYVCISLQRLAQPAHAPGKQRALRSEDDVVAIKTLSMDVDIKDGKFANLQDALTKFTAWRTKIGLPRPTFIVFSGSGGFHAHWVFDEPITKIVWEPLARALVNAGQLEGFVFDYKCTTNPVFIFRLPDTYNHKTNPPHEVFLLHPDIGAGELPVEYPVMVLDQVLTPYKVAYAPRVSQPSVSKLGKPSPVFAGVAMPGRLDDGISSYVPTIEEVAAECPWIDATLQTGGRFNAEPAWREMLRLCHFVQEGEEVAHEMSDQWVGRERSYDPDDVDEKFKNIDWQTYGWPKCQVIEDAGAQECASCPHRAKGKSPLNFAVPLVKAAVAVAAAAAIAVGSPLPVAATPTGPEWLPSPYKHDPTRRIYMSVPDPNSEDKNKFVQEFVFPLPIYGFNIFDRTEEGGKFTIQFECEIRPGMVRHAVVTYGQFMDLRKFGEQLGEVCGIPALPNQLLKLRDLMVAFVHQLREAKERATVFDCAPYGWHKKDGKIEGFVYARQMFNGKAPIPVQPLSTKVDESFKPQGSLDEWKKIIRVVTDQKRPELIAPICASIGAPCTMLAGMNGGVLHLWGESGSGKSSSLKGAQSVWANSGHMKNLIDTTTALDVTLGALRHLPVLYDDANTGKDRDLVNLIMRVGQGRTKARATRTGQDLADQYSWHTMMITSSNYDLHNHISQYDTTTVAAANRVFQIKVDQSTDRTGMLDTGTEANRILAMLEDHHGVAGLQAAQYYGRDPMKRMELVARVLDALDKRVQGGPDDRFMITIAGLTIVGGLVGMHLGLLDIDMDRQEGFMVEQLKEQQIARKSATNNLSSRENVERILAEFVHANADKLLLTREVWTQPNRAPLMWDAKMINSTIDLRGPAVIRAAVDQKIIRVSVPALHEWLQKTRKGMSRGDILPAIKRLIPNARVSQFSLTLGCEGHVTKQSRVEAIEIVDPPFYFDQ